MKSVNSLTFCVIYISFNSLASRTRNDAVELFVRKYSLLWWSFCVLEVIFYSLIQFQDKNTFKCTTKLRSENLWKLRTAIIDRPMRLQLIVCLKKELLSSLSSVKLVLIRNKCYQCKLVCIGLMNEWYKIAYYYLTQLQLKKT